MVYGFGPSGAKPNLISQEKKMNKESICIGERFILKSKILGQDRVILVRLPDKYAGSDVKYPVHYLIDGEYTFHAYSGIIQLKSYIDGIPDAIIVGIPNIVRSHDIQPAKNADKFMEFIADELLPKINGNYQANGTNILFGYSSSGNFVINNFLNNTEYFDIYIAGSPDGLFYYNESKLPEQIDKIKGNKILYLSMGDKDNTKQLEYFNKFCSRLDRIKNELIDLKFEITHNQTHKSNFLMAIQSGLNYIYKME